MSKASIIRASLAATSALVAFVAATPAMAQASNEGAEEADKQIVVIGTRRTDRTVADSASPVDVISSQELTAQPTANMLDAIKNVVPSFFVPQNTISDASTFVRAPSLRGLPSDEILVMLNGKRYNRSALVQVYAGGDTALAFGSQGSDISAIPTIAIANLQVLRDGATAQYGSDAIGGVLNYGLRSDEGIELRALYGQNYDNGGVSIPYGSNGQTWQISGDVGMKLGENGFVNLAGEYFDTDGTSRGHQRASAVNFAANYPALAAQLPNYPGPVQIWGSSPSHGYKLLLNSAYDVGDMGQLYLVVNVAHSKADQSFNYRESVTSTAIAFDGTSNVTKTLGANSSFNPIYLTHCPTGNATCPSNGWVKSNIAGTQQTFNFSSVYPAGFTPRFVGVTDQAYGTLGFKGGDASTGIHYDLSANLSRNAVTLSMYDSLSASYGSASQTSFEFGKLIQREVDVNLDLSHELDAGFASPLTLSAGAEFRRETYEQTAGDEQSYGVGPYAKQILYREDPSNPGTYIYDSTIFKSPGASGYGGTSPASANSYHQSSYGAYVGIEGDVAEKLSMGVAARYEHYDSFGDAFVSKLNAIWHVTDTFSLRGTVGTGFHAPSPGQNNVEILTTSFFAGEAAQVGTYPVTSAIAQYYGAKPLSPEKSTNYGAGFVFNPSSAFTLTVDAYSIKVKNRIGISQSYVVSAADLANEPALAAVGLNGRVQYFTNGFSTTTKGVDVVGSYKTDLMGGKLNLTLAYNYNKSKVDSFDPAVVGIQQRIDIQYLAPNHRAVMSANWQVGNFTVNARESYYGVWRDSNDYPIRAGNVSSGAIIDGQHFGAKFITDLDVSYTFADHYTLTLGANNLFNTYPDKIMATVNNPIYASTQALSNGSVYPRSGGPFGINGGFWYARLRVKY